MTDAESYAEATLRPHAQEQCTEQEAMDKPSIAATAAVSGKHLNP